MKRTLQFLALSIWLLALSLTTTAQTTRRVNGDPNVTGINVYNTIQAAVDAANTDDVILIEPFSINSSTQNYPNGATIGKRVHLRGNGYNLDNPNLMIDLIEKRSAVLGGTIFFETGSSGSSFKYLNGGSLLIRDTNIEVENSFFSSITIGSSFNTLTNTYSSHGTGIIIKKSILGQIADVRDLVSTEPTNLTVHNTFIAGAINSVTTFGRRTIVNSTFINCIFRDYIHDLDGCNFVNSVFAKFGAGNLASVLNSNFSHCFSDEDDLPNGNGNQENIDVNTFFYGPSWSSQGGFETEVDRQLSPTSTGIGAGINGEDIGIYGGTDSYQFSGLPKSPINEAFTNSGVGNNTTNISANATFKAN